ncbi:hypothetical protein, partial [Teichococcus deserti]|uniref:hypothetical protein n=1 Tax=Teichococcus deserti TaxID=1817963 RepID=UPI001A965AEF
MRKPPRTSFFLVLAGLLWMTDPAAAQPRPDSEACLGQCGAQMSRRAENPQSVQSCLIRCQALEGRLPAPPVTQAPAAPLPQPAPVAPMTPPAPATPPPSPLPPGAPPQPGRAPAPPAMAPPASGRPPPPAAPPDGQPLVHLARCPRPHAE